MCVRLPLQTSGECRSDLYPKPGFSGSVKLANIILELRRNQKGIKKESKGTEKVHKKKRNQKGTKKWNLKKPDKQDCA